MFVKLLVVFGFVAVASAADLTVGVEGGKIIFEQNVTASPTIWRQVQNVTVNVTNSDEVISRVVVIDNRADKNGEAKVVEGGEGHENVTIELQGPAVFRGFDFTVQVFAAPENNYSSAPGNPGLDTQNPHVPNVKDIAQEPKKENGNDVILGAPTTSSTEATKINQDKINIPVITGTEQTRLNRDTENQKTSEHTPIATATDLPSGTVLPTKDVQVQQEHDLHKVVDEIFANQKTDQIDQQKKVSGNEMETIVPALNKESNGDKKQTTLTSELSNTTPKNIEEPKIVSVGDNSSTTTNKAITEATQLPGNVKTTHELEHNIKGHVMQHQIPIPYVNH